MGEPLPLPQMTCIESLSSGAPSAWPMTAGQRSWLKKGACFQKQKVGQGLGMGSGKRSEGKFKDQLDDRRRPDRAAGPFPLTPLLPASSFSIPNTFQAQCLNVCCLHKHGNGCRVIGHAAKPLGNRLWPGHSVRTVVLQFMTAWKRLEPVARVWILALCLAVSLTMREIWLQDNRPLKALCRQGRG